MREKALHIVCAEPVRMGLAAEVIHIAKYPLAIGLLGAVGVVVITEHLAYLVHELEAGIRTECRFICISTFHMRPCSIATLGLPYSIAEYRGTWKRTRKNTISGQ